MKLDGSFEPLTALAEILAATFLGAAVGCALFARHRAHSRWSDALAATPVDPAWLGRQRPFQITGPGPYRP